MAVIVYIAAMTVVTSIAAVSVMTGMAVKIDFIATAAPLISETAMAVVAILL
jgi:hypothetical protein